MRTVLVTGGAGYIGSHTCKALRAAGITPVTYDNLIYGHEWAVKWGPFEQGDILDPVRLGEVFALYRPSAVLHFAGFGYVGESVADPAKYYRNNVLGTLSLLEAMRSHRVGQIVFSSTCATYGVPEQIPISEDSRQVPINPYGGSKLMVERILLDYGAAYGLKSMSLRYFNAAGADPEGEIGEDHEPELHLIPLILEAALGIRSEITIFGDDFDTPDGTCVRDYIHVSDIADAHVLALKKLEQGVVRPAYNLGTGFGVSVTELIESVRAITGRDFKVVRGQRRVGDPATLLADPRRARNELGWEPNHPKISDMITTAWNWSIKQRKARPVPAPKKRTVGQPL